MALHKHEISDFVAFDLSQTRALVKRSNAIGTKFRALICVMCIKDQTNALNFTGVLLL
jgi:hypothetical protein